MSLKLQAGAVGVAMLLVFAIHGGLLAYEQVPEGHVGVEKDWGAVNGDVLNPGANWIVPIMQGVQNVEVRDRTYTMSATRGEGERVGADAITVKTADGNSVEVDITVRYRINSQDADMFVSDWNNERQMESRLIRPTIRSVLRDEASSLSTTGNNAIYTQDGRVALEDTATTALERDFEGEPIVLEAVQIRNIGLPCSIDKTLNEKETAKQKHEKDMKKMEQTDKIFEKEDL
jgi:regulator of protease activity HflC (stomatin/prohibitin superfamily)